MTGRWAAGVLLVGCGLGAAGGLPAETPARFPVTPEQVRLAMEGRDWPLAGVQVRLSTPITATVASPALEIHAVSPRPGHEAMLQVACVVRSECLPFFATATWPAENPMPDLRGSARKAAGAAVSGKEATGSADHAAATANFPGGAAKLPGGLTSGAAAIRAGSAATLLLEGDRVHITLHVVFAQSGRVGDTVRVTTPDRKQMFVAEVLSPELLKGEIKP